MNIFKLIPMMADVSSEEDLARDVINKAKQYLENPTEDNLGHLEFVATLIVTKKSIKTAGGIDNLMGDLNHTKTVMEMDEILRSTPNIKTSEN